MGQEEREAAEKAASNESFAELKKAPAIKRALQKRGYLCKVRQGRFCVHIFLPLALRQPCDLADIAKLLGGVGMVAQGTPGRHLATNIYSIQPMHEEA